MVDNNEYPIVGLTKVYPFALVISLLWRSFFYESIHFIASAASALLIAVLIYLANNFWIPTLFPKQGKWKIFNFLNPNK